MRKHRRERKSGRILELKAYATPEATIKQIKDKRYAQKFQGKMAAKRIADRILLVGIGYSRKKKDHHCKVEVMEQ